MVSKLKLLGNYFNRSFKFIESQASELGRLSFDHPKEKQLYKFTTPDDLNSWIVGTDADSGGKSEASLGITENGTAVFTGNLSTELTAGAKISKGGYAAIRTKTPELTLFHKEYINLIQFKQLAIRCRGDRRQYMVNIATNNPFKAYLHQHILLMKTPGEWETIYLDFDRFNVTAYGFTQKYQWAMAREKIKTIGISVVRQPGPFMLEIESIKAVNLNLDDQKDETKWSELKPKFF